MYAAFTQSELVNMIIAGERMIPMHHINSHKVAYECVEQCKIEGIALAHVAEAFLAWTSHPDWTELTAPEYMFLAYESLEDLVDFSTHFRCPEKTITELINWAVDSETLVRSFKFFTEYNFGMCFTQYDDYSKERIDHLVTERKSLLPMLLLNPYDSQFKGYFTHIPNNTTKWNCAGITNIAPPTIGDNMLASYEEAINNAHIFTCGFMAKSLNSKVTKPFPTANVIFAGGAVTKIIDPKFSLAGARQSDVDLFIYAESYEERSQIFADLLEWFRSDDPARPVYYTVRGSVANIYIKNVQRRFQIISMDSKTIGDVIQHFDLAHIQWGISGDNFIGTAAAFEALRSRCSYICNHLRLRTERLIKALYCGYDIKVPTGKALELCDITDLISDINGTALKKMLRGFHDWFYPADMPGMSPEDEDQHIMCMIEKDSEPTIVTMDFNTVVDNIVISGNFENGYESNIFSNFKVDKIVPPIRHAARTDYYLQGSHGTIMLATPLVKVNKISFNDISVDVEVSVADEAFIAFVHNLEAVVYPQITRKAVGAVVIKDGKLMFSATRSQIDNMVSKGNTMIRSSRGEPLDMEEHLHAGDELQVLFSIRFLNIAENAVKLNPTKFVKYKQVVQKVEEVVPVLETSIMSIKYED